jgi:hypothetical protein
MKKSRFSETQIVVILKEADAGLPVQEVCRKHGISSATYYIFSRASSSKMPTSNATIEPFVMTGWLNICSTARMRSKITLLDGSGTTITNDPIWGLEGLPLNRNWPWRPDVYF